MDERSQPVEAVAHDLTNLLTAIAAERPAELVGQLPHHTHGPGDVGSEEIFEP